jgi:hypothetical protein
MFTKLWLLKQQPRPWLIFNVLIILLLWFSFIQFSTPIKAGLDPSWTQTLGYAFKHKLQAGIDYIFTCGPLGYFSVLNSSYDAELFYGKIVWWAIFSFLFAIIFLIRGYQLRTPTEKLVYFFLLIVVISQQIPPAMDILYFAAMVCSTILVIHPPSGFRSHRSYFSFLSLVLLILAVLALAKFSYFILAAICFLGILIHLWHQYSSRIAVSVLVISMIGFLILWILVGQSPANLPAFISNYWQISSGYSEAMSANFLWGKFYLNVITITLTGLMILLACFHQPWQLARFISATIILTSIFIIWKAGIVRHVGFPIFFFMLIVPFFIERPQPMSPIRSWIFSALLFTNIAVVFNGLFYFAFTPSDFIGRWNQQIVNNITSFYSLNALKERNQAIYSQLQQLHDLSQIRSVIKQAPVDIFSHRQSVLFLNQFNYHPRPVFQGHGAYTETLLKINGHFYASNQAPQFVLFQLTAIDGRFPLMEDSQTALVLLRDYKPLLIEKDFLLLKREEPRRENLAINTYPPLFNESVKFGENIDIQSFYHRNLVLSLNIKKSILGKLLQFFFRLPESTYIEIQTIEGDTLSYRLIPSMTRLDFFLNPLILTTENLVRWYAKPLALKRVHTLRIVLKNQWLHYLFQPNIEISISESQISPYPIDEVSKKNLLTDFYPAFNTIPDYLVGNINRTMENQQPVLMVHAPGEMHFQLTQSGIYTFSSEFGILAGAYDPIQNKSPTDGVEFSVSLLENEQETVLFKRLLQPLKLATDRGIQSSKVTVQINTPGKLILRTHPGPANSPLSDWSFWRAIQIVHTE